ncbi:hypothetical protein BJ165DRAFT_1059297 [Panaeolus papilionaceus]|nr:hypothetical protein BJ165DRAFT_1059297 [Panaeolus papilionaceus]
MCNPILGFLVHVWVIFTSYFSSSSSAPTVLPVSTASSTIYTARSRTYASSGTKARSEPENWKAQKEQFLRHPSLRRSSSHRSTRTADGTQRSVATPGNSGNHWDHYIGQEKHPACSDSLVPQSISPHLPAVIVTPCTPSVDSSKPSEEQLQFASPVGSPLDMTIASYRAILPFPTILKTNRTPSRRRRDKEKSTGKRIRFNTADAHDILEDFDNPFRFSEASSESPSSFSYPEGDHLSCFSDSMLLPPESPSPPAAESTIRNHHDAKIDAMTYPWDFPSWTTNTDRNDIADPNLPSYMTSTPPRKQKIVAAHDLQALQLASRASYRSRKDLSEAVLELLPYPDVFDLDMYFCEITMRHSLPPPLGLEVASPSPVASSQSASENHHRELDIGTTALGPAFDLISDKKGSEPTTPPTTPFSERRNRLWTFTDNQLTMPNTVVEADILNYKDIYRHTAYSKPSVIYSTKLPSPPLMKHTPPNNHPNPTPTRTPIIRPLLAAKSTGPNHSPRPPSIVIVSHCPFDSMKPHRNRSRSPSLKEKNNRPLTSGPKPEDLMRDSDSARSMESLKARLREAYDNFSKPTWMDESESWERVPLT